MHFCIQRHVSTEGIEKLTDKQQLMITKHKDQVNKEVAIK
jgi:hypothetical protein